MEVLYSSEHDVAEFDIDRYYKSLSSYGAVNKNKVQTAVDTLEYDPVHYSVLVELGVQLLDEDAAKRYYADHKMENRPFERLRRITGYLVGSLERWNDAKQAEEKARVKHNIENYIKGKR